jgi:putative hydrolases of HD superfamily
MIQKPLKPRKGKKTKQLGKFFLHEPHRIKDRPLLGLWEEFEARETPEAKFTKAIDRFMPIFSNLTNGGASWQPNQIAVSQVRALSEKICDGSYPLWEIVDQELNKAVEEGSLQE